MEEDAAFDLPPLDGFPVARGDTASVKSDEFVDAAAFLADHGPNEDSFLREASGGGDWSDDDARSQRRASSIFVPKSRDMDHVEFSSPERGARKSFSAFHETPRKTKHAFSTTTTAVSSEYEIHVDNRLVLTPNSFKYLQAQQRERPPLDDLTPLSSKASTHETDHSFRAKQVVDANADAVSTIPEVRLSSARSTSAEKAMQAGPGVIKKALHEIEAFLRPPLDSEDGDSDAGPDPSLEKLKQRLRDIPLPVGHSDFSGDRHSTFKTSSSSDVRLPQQEQVFAETEEIRDELVQADQQTAFAEAGVQTEECEDDEDQCRSITPREQRDSSPYESKNMDRTGARHATTQSVERHRQDHLSQPSHSSSVVKSSVDAANWTDIHENVPQSRSKRSPVVNKRTEHEPASENPISAPARPVEARRGASYRTAALRQSLDATGRRTSGLDSAEDHLANKKQGVRTLATPEKRVKEDRPQFKAKVDGLPLAASVPNQMARRCRRFLCTVGERMSEEVVFSNGSSKIGRICVSLLPLSSGCQQFSISPAVLELQPRSSNSFLVTFSADHAGVVAGIFQFRAVGVDGLYEPYELLIEASVRGDLPLPAPTKSQPKPQTTRSKVIRDSPESSRVTELPAKALRGVRITPTFLRFSPADGADEDNNGIHRTSIRISNMTEDTATFQVKSSHEHLEISSMRGTIPPGSEIQVQVQPLCRPFGVGGQISSDWCGSMTVIVEDILSREVSVVIDRSALAALPTFDEAARVRQAISSQTDSFYYTKKVNRRGLYFHARAVECGNCVVGESHQVPVYICNGSDAPITVLLQDLQDPFSCSYQPTTLLARKFIEVSVTFTPKAVGKVATCLVAYTVNGKAAVTLIARGVDRPASSAPVKS